MQGSRCWEEGLINIEALSSVRTFQRYNFLFHFRSCDLSDCVIKNSLGRERKLFCCVWIGERVKSWGGVGGGSLVAD